MVPREHWELSSGIAQASLTQRTIDAVESKASGLKSDILLCEGGICVTLQMAVFVITLRKIQVNHRTWRKACFLRLFLTCQCLRGSLTHFLKNNMKGGG